MDKVQELITLFAKMADNISANYSNEIAASAAIKGARPEFEELIGNLKHMEKELTGKAVKIAEAYKAQNGSIPDELTTGLKNITTSAIEKFVKSIGSAS
ncbi:MAG: hypothetical protein JST82_00815 [Bacteroidetes bacterium]|nr:hypothetical protein [Bacteroidota bacterium]